jgi:hypothetical protein
MADEADETKSEKSDKHNKQNVIDANKREQISYSGIIGDENIGDASSEITTLSKEFETKPKRNINMERIMKGDNSSEM